MENLSPDGVIEQLKAKYNISSETEMFLRSRMELIGNRKDLTELSKEKYEEETEMFNEKLSKDFDGTIREFLVPASNVPKGVLVDVLKPKECPRRPGILVLFHGGGSVFGSRKSIQPTCLLLASELKCIVVNVEYRLAPEHKFPAAFDDAKAVCRWVIMNKSLIGGENDSKVGVCGSSAGGGIALSTAFDVKGIDYQILVYPFVDMRCEDASYEEFEFPGTGINMAAMVRTVVEKTITKEEDKLNPRCSPVLREDFSTLPPTLLFIAEIDHLKESNYVLKSKLKAANVVCVSKLMKGACHAFFSHPGIFADANQRSREIIAQFYKKHGVC